MNTTYYFLASIDNATSKAVRILQASTVSRSDALAQAAISLSNAGYDVSAIQSMHADAYFAAVSAPVWCNNADVSIRPTASLPLAPVHIPRPASASEYWQQRKTREASRKAAVASVRYVQ